MTPYFETPDGRIAIYQGDCREVLPTLESGAASVVVTDPPYGINFDYGDYHDDPAAYPDMMREWINEAQRIVGDGPFFVWQAMLNCDRWHEWFPPGFRMFAACKEFVQLRATPIQFAWDPVIFWGQLRGATGVYRKDWTVQTVAPFGSGRRSSEHPCPRPIEQTRYVVSIASVVGDTVLDPFMGSGTTLRAAMDLGLNAIGIEIEERYCEIAARRLSQQVLPLEAS